MSPLLPRLASATLLAVAPLLSCSGEARSRSDGFNVLVVVLDALRADKVGFLGFDRETTPHLDALARDPDSVVFENHYAQAPFTKTSTASLFTGLFPFQHGVLSGHNKTATETWREVTTPILSDGLDTLAERLERRGFFTFGVVKSRHLVPEYGFAQGFERYLSPADAKSDEERRDAVLALAAEAPRRFFGYVHFSACHHPYPPEGRDPDYLRRYGFAYDEEARRTAGVDFTTPEIKHAILEGRVRLEPDDVRFLHLIYEATLRHVDRTIVGPLLDGLKRRGLYDSTLVVVTADHGEELYDHEGYAHSYHVWNEILRVPLLVKFPKGRRPPALPDRVDTLSSTIDLLPTLLDFTDGREPDGLPGVSLLGPASQGFVLAEQLGRAKRRWALVRDGWKLIHEQSSVEEGLFATDGTSHLFDLRRDPGERRDLAAVEPERVAEMEGFARAVFAKAPGPRTQAPVIETELDPDAVEELRQLGYIK